MMLGIRISKNISVVASCGSGGFSAPVNNAPVNYEKYETFDEGTCSAGHGGLNSLNLTSGLYTS